MQEPPLIELLHEPDPDLGTIIDRYVNRYNSVYGRVEEECWDITGDDWQRYEFLGDRVLNLIIAQHLFSLKNPVMDEGEMTVILNGVASNRALDLVLRQSGTDSWSKLIPAEIGAQKSYGERITGGAFEAFIGALYCEYGMDEVVNLIGGILASSFQSSDPEWNAIGTLQEYVRKKFDTLPEYRETGRSGPDHKPLFVCTVLINGNPIGEGVGSRKSVARQEAARKALDHLKAH